MPDDVDAVDQGLAGERTDLAWTRSGLAVAVCIAVLLRHLWPLHGDRQVVALVCISAGALAWAVTLVVGRRASTTRSERDRMSVRKAETLTIGTLALAIAAFVLALFPPA